MPISGAELLGKALKQHKARGGNSDERTTPIGLFLYARAYAEAGAHLHAAKLSEGHQGEPVQFLLMHSIELYLKSFLRLRGHSAKKLRAKGHGFAWLAKKAEDHGARAR